jgi:hypothetical protein
MIRTSVEFDMFVPVFGILETLKEKPACDSITLEAPLFVVKPTISVPVIGPQLTGQVFQELSIAIQCCFKVFYTDLVTRIELLMSIDVTGQQHKVIAHEFVSFEHSAVLPTILDDSRVQQLVKSLSEFVKSVRQKV